MTKEEKEGEAGGDDDMEEDVTLGTERLRMRAKKRPSYTEDVPEGLDEDVLDSEEDGEDVPSDDFCSICHQGGKLLCCDTCTSVYHLQCLDPPLKTVPKGKWSCPTCIDPLRDIEKILDCQMRPHGSPSASEEEQHDGHVNKAKPSVRQYLVKWRSKSYLHCSWIPEQEIENSAKSIQGLRAKFLNFKNKFEYSKDNLEDDPPIRTEWTTVDRIIDQRKNGEVKEYYVKWKELGYEESTWEVEEDIAQFQHQIDMYKAVMARGTKKAKRKGTALEGKEMKKRRKVFTAIESTPDCLKGGVLHPYQLEGLNFLRFAWQQEKHVILADEMGLGKTIQSIAFVASLAEEGVYLPHLVVAPLSTLRNWEREFATWAPQINTVMYVGHAAARALIRQYEFYYPKKMFLKKEKAKKKHGPINKTSKMDRIKFHVLLTSYEMINIDSATLKSIEWECLIVDEGHRLKNKDSKLFQTLRNYSTRHRVLLTGTPLQNNLDELFTLMHFLDASKFSSLEDFQQEFKDINQEEQVRRLHKILASHLLRRVKKDVMKDLPPKKELILRVELSPLQKEYYKAVLTRNYEVLSRHGGPMVSLNNVVMELRKICGHPFLLEGVEPVGKSEEVANRQRLEASGKLLLLDKMMVKLKAAGHRVLVYSQFQIMLDILEDWCLFKNWHYERIDGKITGAERQIRIDRFNAPNSSRFCFLLSTRAGGLGINLATADTVVIYDSDWNPHADLQAMARAHRLGQTNTVMIYRLVTRGTIEERMMQMTKKKMVLEHLVVGRMKTQVLNQEELDDILRYGAKELFSDDTDEASKAKQIRYDDAAIDRLLDRSQVGAADEMSIDDAEDNDVLKAFKVANFEYVDEEDAEMTKLQEAEREAEADRESEKMDALERSKYWENLLKEKYDQQKYELSQELGKGKRSRKQVSRYECAEDDLAGMGYVSSDEEDGEQETIAIDVSETNRSATEPITKKQPGKKRARGPAPLMEGDERSLKVLGFSRKQRTRFVQILMRFGLGDFSWSQFTAHFKQKSLEEIKEYGTLFLTHIAEDLTHALTFSDGVPKEGLRIQDVLVRVAVLHLINNKVKLLSEDPSASLFSVGTYSKFSSLKTARVWNESHDWKLLRAIVKHGYGRWFEIIEDADYDLHSVIRQELAAPQASAMQEPESVPSSETIQNGNISINGANRQQSVEPLMSNGEENRPIDVDLTSCREATEGQFLKREIDFMKKRTLLLERVLNAEYHLESLDEERVEDAPAANQNRCPESAVQGDSGLGNQKPARQDDPPHFPILLAQDEISAAAVDDDEKRLEIARIYNQMCAVLSENRTDAIQTYAYNKSAGVRLRKSIRQLDFYCLELRKSLFAKPASVSAKDETNEHARPCTPNGGDDTFENESNIEATCDVENEDKIQKQKNGNSPRSQDDHVSHVSEQKNDATTQVSTDSQDDCYIVDNTNQNIRKSPVRTFHTNTWPQKIVVLDD